jgi:hypothetical protein
MGQESDQMRRDDDLASYREDRSNEPTAEDATSGQETAAIRANIEQTRTEMSSTIDAIQEQLNPERLKEQLKDQVKEQFEEAKANVREATIGKAEDMVRMAGNSVDDARSTLMETIRQNPIPAAMVGIGLGWLFMNRRSPAPHRQTPYDGRYREYGSSDYGRDWRGADSEGRQRAYGREYGREYDGENVLEKGQRAVGDAVSRVQDAAGHLADQAQEKAEHIADRAQSTVDQVVNQAQETAGSLRHQTHYQAQRFEDRFGHTLYETPLAVGAIAFALGTAVGLAAPQTRQENAFMGEARDNLVEKAQEVAQDTVEKLQHVAGQVVDEAQSTAKEAAKEQGLVQERSS